MAKDLIAHQLVRDLEARNVEHAIGPCGHTNIVVLSALAKSRLTFVSVRQERISAHFSDSYARVTG